MQGCAVLTAHGGRRGDGGSWHGSFSGSEGTNTSLTARGRCLPCARLPTGPAPPAADKGAGCALPCPSVTAMDGPRLCGRACRRADLHKSAPDPLADLQKELDVRSAGVHAPGLDPLLASLMTSQAKTAAERASQPQPAHPSEPAHSDGAPQPWTAGPACFHHSSRRVAPDLLAMCPVTHCHATAAVCPAAARVEQARRVRLQPSSGAQGCCAGADPAMHRSCSEDPAPPGQAPGQPAAATPPACLEATKQQQHLQPAAGASAPKRSPTAGITRLGVGLLLACILFAQLRQLLSVSPSCGCLRRDKQPPPYTPAARQHKQLSCPSARCPSGGILACSTYL